MFSLLFKKFKSRNIPEQVQKECDKEIVLGHETLVVDQDFLEINGKIYQKESEPFGKGSSGEIFKGKDPVTEKAVAIKKMTNPQQENKTFEDFNEFLMHNELSLLQELKHPNIPQFFTGFCSLRITILVMELVSCDLFNMIEKKQVNEALCLKVAHDISAVLIYLHQLGIIHGDIKPENILIRQNWDVLLADFGSAIRLQDPAMKIEERVGTRPYMAPEILKREPHGIPADMWSLGVTLLVLGQGGGLIWAHAKNEKQQIKAIERMIPNIPTYLNHYPGLKTIVPALLEIKPNKRETAVETNARVKGGLSR